jgi:hypothetical protein
MKTPEVRLRDVAAEVQQCWQGSLVLSDTLVTASFIIIYHVIAATNIQGAFYADKLQCYCQLLMQTGSVAIMAVPSWAPLRITAASRQCRLHQRWIYMEAMCHLR